MKPFSSLRKPNRSPFSKEHREGFTALKKQKLPSPLKTIVRLLVFIIVVSIAFMIFVPWVQTAPGTGQITALNPDDRAQKVNALVGGRIKHWYVREGSAVKKGDPLVEIVDNDSMLLERLESERNALEQNFKVAKIAAETANLDYQRQEDLFDKGLASRRDYEQAKIQYKSYLALESKALAELNQSQVRLARQDTQILRAPRDGIIVNIIAGDIATTVKEGQPVADFVPSNVVLAAEIFIDGLDVPLLTEGRKVRLMFEGWPAVQFSGWPSTAVGTFGGVVQVIDPAVSLNGRFRVMVTPDPDDEPWPSDRFLRLGAQARGWVQLDTVSVGFELWRQLNNFPPRLTQAPSQGQSGANPNSSEGGAQ